MDILWKEGALEAKYVAETLAKALGWNKNTTYTLIKRCIKKGTIERSEPNFMCHALIPKEKVQEAETNELIDKIYDGSADKLFAALLSRKKLSAKQIERLKQIVFEDGTVWNNPDYENWFHTYVGKEVATNELQNYYPHTYKIECD